MIEVTVAGIPAQAEITYYDPGHAGCCTSGPVPSYSAIMAPEPEDLEFMLYDRRGYPAEWLERKLEDREVYEDVEAQVIADIRADIAESKAMARASRLGVDY